MAASGTPELTDSFDPRSRRRTPSEEEREFYRNYVAGFGRRPGTSEQTHRVGSAQLAKAITAASTTRWQINCKSQHRRRYRQTRRRGVRNRRVTGEARAETRGDSPLRGRWPGHPHRHGDAQYRPVAEIQFDGFVFPAGNQITTQFAKIHNRSDKNTLFRLRGRGSPRRCRRGGRASLGNRPRRLQFCAHRRAGASGHLSPPHDAYWMTRKSIEMRDR